MSEPAGFISGTITDSTQKAQFQATADCPGPIGSITGTLLASLEGLLVKYEFSSDAPHSTVVLNAGDRPLVLVLYRNAKVSDC